MVEFARDRQLEGASTFDAAVEAAPVRLRPIVMTTMASIHMVPPHFAFGAGAEMRREARLPAPSRGETKMGGGESDRQQCLVAMLLEVMK
jgi:hypothetical protein